MSKPMHEATSLAKDLTRYIDDNPTPFHVVRSTIARLKNAGFTELREGEPWTELVRGGKYYVVRGGKTIGAFVVGQESPDATGLRFVGAHTDSPGLRVKPMMFSESAGITRINIEPYGGALLHDWLSHDLGLAGQVIVRKPNGTLRAKLVKIEWPLAFIPQLAINLNRSANDKLELNKQTDFPAVIAIKDEDNQRQIINLLLRAAVCTTQDELVSFELSLFSLEKGTIAGLNGEFIRSARLDNQTGCHAGLSALLKVNNPRATCLLVMFDHEEIGSRSAQGADSRFTRDLMERICKSASADPHLTIARSFGLSVDVSHATLPNHPEVHEPNHRTQIGSGPSVKWNSDVKYATDSISGAVYTELARQAHVPTQDSVNRSDLLGGSTIGKFLASLLGIPVVDTGIPLWSMHGIRETAGVQDHYGLTQIITEFLSTDDLPQIT